MDPYRCGCAAFFLLYLFIIHLNWSRHSFIGVSIVFCVYKNPFEEKNNVIYARQRRTQLVNFLIILNNLSSFASQQ